MKHLSEKLGEWSTCDSDTLAHVKKHIDAIPTLEVDRDSGLRPKQMFWPPRVVRAVKEGSLRVFFGSGVSLAAGLPTWMGLLRDGGLKDDFEKDPYASGDMLTLAELAAHTSGAGALQNQVRIAMDTADKSPTLAHNLLAALCQHFYITTNYDTLFEKSWHKVHGIESEEDKRRIPVVVTTDDDVRRIFGISKESEIDAAISVIVNELGNKKNCVLFKIHGSVAKQLEYLVLTRSDYRRHYRTNRLMFSMVKRLMAFGHTLFLGFGHRDPEIIRLIDDVVHEYENQRFTQVKGNAANPRWPGIYSLQFDMLKRTPEVFAARGIVALQPPFILAQPNEEVKGFRLAQGIVDLIHNSDFDIHEKLSFDGAIQEIAKYVDAQFESVLGRLADSFQQRGLKVLDRGVKTEANALAKEVLVAAPEFSNQGAYIVGADGIILGLALPKGLDDNWRLKKVGSDLGSRPYFRQANSLREPFVSDSFPSQFNENSTISVCLPLLKNKQFAGLLFTAHQLRDEDKFLKEVIRRSASGGTLLMVDSNGILLFPPDKEFGSRTPKADRKIPEDVTKNIGFEYARLLYLSRRDKRVERISQNVVPLAQDDDVYPVALDATVYTVLTELRFARWKIALTRFFPSKFQTDEDNKR